MSAHDVPKATLFEAEAGGVLLRAVELGRARSTVLDQADAALRAAKRDDLVRALEKLRELDRIVAVRVELLARRVAEGA